MPRLPFKKRTKASEALERHRATQAFNRDMEDQDWAARVGVDRKIPDDCIEIAPDEYAKYNPIQNAYEDREGSLWELDDDGTAYQVDDRSDILTDGDDLILEVDEETGRVYDKDGREYTQRRDGVWRPRKRRKVGSKPTQPNTSDPFSDDWCPAPENDPPPAKPKTVVKPVRTLKRNGPRFPKVRF